jgi:hypothetical protein
MDTLELLQKWYENCCDGDWEHTYGVKIDTLDNPGWSIDIDLTETVLELQPFKTVEVDRNDQDWMRCWVDNGVFKGRGGPKNLNEILGVFLNWSIIIKQPSE